jgi:hypothetical protein
VLTGVGSAVSLTIYQCSKTGQVEATICIYRCIDQRNTWEARSCKGRTIFGWLFLVSASPIEDDAILIVDDFE